MKTLWRNLTREVPGSWLAVGFWLFVACDQSHWWSQKEDYSFGWLVPLFTAYVVHERWSAFKAAAAACAAPGSPRVAGWRRWVLGLVIAGLLLGGALMFLLDAFYRAGAGPSYPGTLAITMGTAGLLFGLLLTHAPASPSPIAGGWRDDARLRLTALFIFPVMIWFVSAPMVSVIENQLSVFLLHKVVTVVSFCFDLLGLPVEQQGNTLVLPTGRVDGKVGSLVGPRRRGGSAGEQGPEPQDEGEADAGHRAMKGKPPRTVTLKTSRSCCGHSSGFARVRG